MVGRRRGANSSNSNASVGPVISSLNGLEPLHKLPVNVILYLKGSSPIQGQPLLFENPGGIAEVEDNEIIASWVKGHERPSVKACHKVVIQYWIFPHRIDTDLVQGPLLKMDAVTSAKNLRKGSALEKGVDQSPWSGPVGTLLKQWSGERDFRN